MPRSRIPVTNVSQIYVEPRPEGLRAVYLVETTDERQADDLSKLFGDFSPAMESIQLSNGKLVAYAVQLKGHDQALLEDVETFLKKNFGFVILHRSFDPLIYDIVKELSRDSGSELVQIPKCDICGKHDPFPATMVSFMDAQETNLSTRTYCATCTAESAGRSNKEFLTALLDADRGDLRVFSQMGLVRSRSSKKKVAFRIKADVAQHCVAT